MSTETRDTIDFLAGIEAGSALDGIRHKRMQARENAQASYLALFEPADFGEVNSAERFAIASFVAGIHGQSQVANFYMTRLAKAVHGAELLDSLKVEIDRGNTAGPYGAFPDGPLSAENKAGLIYRVAADHRRVLGGKLAAALEHAHMLVFRPRDAAPSDMQALLDASWSTTGIVTLSQLVAFLSFQIRVVVGLRALGASMARQTNAAGA